MQDRSDNNYAEKYYTKFACLQRSKACDKTSTWWAGRISFVILENRRKNDHSLSITSPSDSPTPLQYKGLNSICKCEKLQERHYCMYDIPDIEQYDRRHEKQEQQVMSLS